MSNLSNQQINNTFDGILQVPGGITSTLQTVQDGNGNPTGLQLSSSGANVTTSDTYVASNDGVQIVGAEPRLISDGFGDYVSVKDFGAIGNGISDDTLAFNNAFASCNNVYVPPGTYLLTNTPTAPTQNFCLFGCSSATTIIKIQHLQPRALLFSPASSDVSIKITNLSFQAFSSLGPCPLGIEINYPSSSSLPFGLLEISNINFISDASAGLAPNTWARGLKISNAWYPVIDNIQGRSYFLAGDTGSSGFCELAGGNYGCIAPKFSKITWNFGAFGILISAYCEGLMLSESEFVGVTKGLCVPSSTPTGGVANLFRSMAFWINQNHIAAHTSCVDLDLVSDITANQINIQRWADPSATNWIGYLLNNVQYPQIISGTIAGNEESAGISTSGIVATGGYSAHGIVENIHFENLDLQFSLDANTTRWTIRNNVATGLLSDNYLDSGMLNDIEWKRTVDGWISRKIPGCVIAGRFYQSGTESGVSSASAATYTGLQFVAPVLIRSGSAGAVSDTLPTASQIISSIPGCTVNTYYIITIVNLCGGTLSLLPNTGTSLTGPSNVITPAWCRQMYVRIANITVGSESVVVFGLSHDQLT